MNTTGCAICERKGYLYRLFVGVRALDCATRKYTVDFRCSNGHDWIEVKEWPTQPTS
jgi:hypothetical protein